jgi:hypothetical protein
MPQVDLDVFWKDRSPESSQGMVKFEFDNILLRMNRESSHLPFRRKYEGETLESLAKISEKRYNLTNNHPNVAETLPRFIRPSSESRLIHSLAAATRSTNSSEKKMYNKLSYQLKEIQESISHLAERRKKPSKYKRKVITEVSDVEHKKKVYQEVLSQIKEIKNNRYHLQDHPREES